MNKFERFFFVLLFFWLSIQMTLHHETVLNKIEDSKKHNERFQKLIRDSVKTHKWIENVKLNYQDLKNLEG